MSQPFDGLDALEALALDTLGGMPGLGEVTACLRQICWAEEEIAAAEERHPLEADLVHNAFTLLRGTHELMRTEFVYRAHARELLERVAARQDTRPGTDAELAIVCCETSLSAPLTSAGTCLYARIWARAFPDKPQPFGDELGYLENSHGYGADELERGARRRMSQDWRRFEKPRQGSPPAPPLVVEIQTEGAAQLGLELVG